jgi:hypothetical protein
MDKDAWALIFTCLFYGGFIGFGCGLVVSKILLGRTIKYKADTGIRLESGGKLYTIHSVDQS